MIDVLFAVAQQPRISAYICATLVLCGAFMLSMQSLAMLALVSIMLLIIVAFLLLVHLLTDMFHAVNRFRIRLMLEAIDETLDKAWEEAIDEAREEEEQE